MEKQTVAELDHEMSLEIMLLIVELLEPFEMKRVPVAHLYKHLHKIGHSWYPISYNLGVNLALRTNILIVL